MRARFFVVGSCLVAGLAACGGDDAAVVSKKKSGAGGAASKGGSAGAAGLAVGGQGPGNGGASTSGGSGFTGVGGDGGGGPGGTGGQSAAPLACPGSSPQTAGEFRACVADVLCADLQPCCSPSDIGEVCGRTYRGILDAGLETFDQPAAVACLAELAKRPAPAACAASAIPYPAVCATVLRGMGAKKLGETCRSDGDCAVVPTGVACGEWKRTDAAGTTQGRICQTTVRSPVGGPCNDKAAYPPVGTAHECDAGVTCENGVCAAPTMGGDPPGDGADSLVCAIFDLAKHPFVDAVADAVCAKAVGCCQAGGRTLDAASCRAWTAYTYPFYAAFAGLPLPPADGRAADPAALTACLAAIGAAPDACATPLGALSAFGIVEVPEVQSPCAKLFPSPSPVAPGGSCADRWDCAVPAVGLAQCVKKVCVVYKPVGLGEACTEQSPFGGSEPPATEVSVCASDKGLRCGADKKCAVRPPLASNGAACSSGDDCQSARCDKGTCAARAALGKPCAVNAECVTDRCVDGVCDFSNELLEGGLAAGACR